MSQSVVGGMLIVLTMSEFCIKFCSIKMALMYRLCLQERGFSLG